MDFVIRKGPSGAPAGGTPGYFWTVGPDGQSVRLAPPPAGDLIVGVVPFAFNTASPVVLAPLPAGSSVIRAGIVILTPFDGAPSLSLGTPGSPALIMAPSDSLPGAAGQYETDILTSFVGADSLQLTIVAGGATTGNGLVFFEHT